MAKRVRVYDADDGGYIIVPVDLPSKDEAQIIYRELRKAGFPRQLRVACRERQRYGNNGGESV